MVDFWLEDINFNQAVANELLDGISKLNIPETGLRSFGIRGILGLDQALDESTFEQIVEKCSNLKQFCLTGS